MVAIDEKSVPSSDASRRCTWPALNHLYQRMALDTLARLHDDRTRDYSPTPYPLPQIDAHINSGGTVSGRQLCSNGQWQPITPGG